jgi:hypothetical protein
MRCRPGMLPAFPFRCSAGQACRLRHTPRQAIFEGWHFQSLNVFYLVHQRFRHIGSPGSLFIGKLDFPAKFPRATGCIAIHGRALISVQPHTRKLRFKTLIPISIKISQGDVGYLCGISLDKGHHRDPVRFISRHKGVHSFLGSHSTCHVRPSSTEFHNCSDC